MLLLGTILFRNTQWARDFLAEWWKEGEKYPDFLSGRDHEESVTPSPLSSQRVCAQAQHVRLAEHVHCIVYIIFVRSLAFLRAQPPPNSRSTRQETSDDDPQR
eukprot:483027-Rhodomonas_salina.2